MGHTSALTCLETRWLLAANRDTEVGVLLIDGLTRNKYIEYGLISVFETNRNYLGVRVFFLRAVIEERTAVLEEGTELNSCMMSPKISSSWILASR